MTLKQSELDRAIWEEELEDFVPPLVFDAHTHVYDLTKRQDLTGLWSRWPLSNREKLNEVDGVLFPGRDMHRLSFGCPLFDDPLDSSNAFTLSETAHDPASAALALVRPDMDTTLIEKWLDHDGFLGLKPYRMHSVTGDTVECRIADYLPEEQIAALNGHGGMIMLHMAKRAAISDPDNLDDLEHFVSSYPNVHWILAHCARSYYDRPLLRAADRLRAIPNLWYEISSVCDPDAMDVLLSIGGPDRVMYGSDDIPVGVSRGKYITFGHSWAGLSEGNHSLRLDHCDGRMTFTRYESLRAFRRACWRHGYGQTECRRLFHDNAAGLVGLIRKSRARRA